MRIQYNVPGKERKILTTAIAQEISSTVKYLGPPSFAYEIGGYRIDKNGTLTGADNRSLIADLQGIHGFVPVSMEYEADTEAEIYADREMRRLKLDSASVPDYSNRGQYGGDNVPSFEDLQMDECEELGLGCTRREDPQGENGMQASDIPETYEPDQLAIEIPLSSFTDETISNLQKLIDSKANLIKKAIGAESLLIEQTEKTLRFPWFNPQGDAEAVRTYIHFVTALCDMAKTLQRVNAAPKEVDNEKYAFRCFLLRLGFIGAEYKSERKILLANLTGNSAFKNLKEVSE